jgi:hypothetical protein
LSNSIEVRGGKQNVRATYVSGPSATEGIVEHLDCNPCDTGGVVAILDPNILALRTRYILVDSVGQVVGIASHSLATRSAELHILGVVGIDLGDLATLIGFVRYHRLSC